MVNGCTARSQSAAALPKRSEPLSTMTNTPARDAVDGGQRVWWMRPRADRHATESTQVLSVK